jgi:hypothetical protein
VRIKEWQDWAIETVVARTSPQSHPWVVYTCGPMGAGKGYTLSWMSRHGYFPIEDIVCIDPDHFKKMMPEWGGYVLPPPRLSPPAPPPARTLHGAAPSPWPRHHLAHATT